MRDHAHMSHIVIVTDVFGATIAAGISIQCAAAGGDREVHGNLDSFSWLPLFWNIRGPSQPVTKT